MSSRIFACLSLALASLPAVAAEPESTSPNPFTPVAAATVDAEQTDRTIRRAIRQLDSDTFAERREAAEALRDAGAAAITPLEEACRDGAGERVAQSIDILKSFAGSEDREVSAAALKALQNVAEGENATAAKLAATAVQSMRKLPGRQDLPGVLGGRFGGGEGFPPAEMRGLGGNFSMSTVRNNGREEIKINDGDLHVEIEKDPNGPIRIEWKQGDAEAHVAQADDMDQLREKHPDAAQMYDKYQERIAGVPGMFGGQRFFAPARLEGLAIPQPMFQMDDHFARMREEHQRMIDDMRAQHEARMQEMRRMAPARPGLPPTQLQRLRQDAEQLRQRVENGEVDAATQAEIVRLQQLLDALQRQADQ